MNTKILVGILAALLGAGLLAYFQWPRINNAHSLNSSATLGFSIVSSESGVTVWKSQDGQTYVTEIDLSKVALKSLTGELPGNDRVGQRTIQQFWQQAQQQPGQAKVVINGTFFQTYDRPTGVAFGLKKDGRVITYGYGLKEFPTQTSTVAWNDHSIVIAPYQRSTFDGSMPNVVGALDATAGKNAGRYLSRTFIGTKNRRSDGTYQTALLFSSLNARQQDATQILQNFGANQVAMLDGGRSTGLVLNGQVTIQPKTKIPHAIGVFLP